MRILGGGTIPVRSTSRYRHLRLEATEFLLGTLWRLGEVRNLGLRVSSGEIRRRIERSRETSFPGAAAEAASFMHATGESQQDVEYIAQSEAALALLRAAATRHRENVSRAQIRQFYEHHAARYIIPERRVMTMTNRKSAAAANVVKREVARGKSFAGMSVPEVRTIVTIAPGKHRAPLEAAIVRAKPHRLVGPVFQRVDYYVFEVRRVLPSFQQPLTQVAGRIRRQLEGRALQRARTAFTESWISRWKTVTRCQPEYTLPACSEYRGSAKPTLGFGVE